MTKPQNRRAARLKEASDRRMPIAGEPDWFQSQMLDGLKALQDDVSQLKTSVAEVKMQVQGNAELETRVGELEGKVNKAIGGASTLGLLGAAVWGIVKLVWKG